ncbi:MAG: PQQ-binding-like beta-propeller repeat protein [Polyangiales bacterium]
MRRLALIGLVALSCRARPRQAHAVDAGADDASRRLRLGPLVGFAPTRPAESSQPRWRYLARGARPRGVERWRYDLTPREPSGEPATDGRTVFVAAARALPAGLEEGEVFAFDLLDGSLRWHTPVGGLHGEPLEYAEGLVLIDTTAHCASREDDAPGLGARACRDARPGGVVALDAATGRERFHTRASSGILNARWTMLRTADAHWIHDGATALRGLRLPSGDVGARMHSAGIFLQGVGVGVDLVAVTDARGRTAVSRFMPGVARPRWERAVPWRGSCAPVIAGPLVVLPGFSARGLAGAPRALSTADGGERWTAGAPPTSVETCAASEEGVLWQVRDNALQGNALFDGRARAPRPLAVAPTSDVSALVDGVFYVSQPRELLGLDVSSGRPSVRVRTDARAVAGLIVWAGRGVALTREPGLVLGFD